MARSARAVMRVAGTLNQLQFLTIRRYLTPGLRNAGPAAPGGRGMALSFDLVAQASQMLLVLAIAPLVLGVTRKVKARLLRRIGPPLWQPYLDLWKLLHKEAVLAHNASWLYRAAPYLIFATTWVGAALVPTYATNLMFSWSADLIAIVALLGHRPVALALAGMDVGTAFGGIGSSREMMISSLAEPAMLLVVFTVALIAGTTQLSSIATTFVNASDRARAYRSGLPCSLSCSSPSPRTPVFRSTTRRRI